MTASVRSILGWGMLSVVLGVVCWSVVGGAERSSPAVVAADAPRTLPTATVMHAKLTSTQQVLAGLLSEDYARIASSARELVGLARDVPPHKTGDDVEDQVYEHFRYEMLRLSAELERMGQEQNLSGAAYAHGNLTSACIGCHQHLRDAGNSIELMGHAPARALYEVEGAAIEPANSGDR